MSRSAAAPVATPGVHATPTTDSGETDADAVMAGAPDLNDGAPQARPDPKGKTVTMSQAELQAMLNQAAAQGAAAVHRAAAPKANPDAELPDQSEIDPAKIKSPTLSKQGYVVPLGYGEPANPAIKR